MRKKVRYFLFGLLSVALAVGFTSCEQENDMDVRSTEARRSLRITNLWNSNPYKVNIVYFIPNDLDTLPDYRSRLSGVLLHIQSFYASSVQRAGFGNTSFGLDLLSDNEVNIHVVRGQQGKASYPYDGGKWPAIITEVDQYFASHSIGKLSEHTLIIIPSYNDDPLNPGGPPFYGVGRNCFALDYPDMDVKYLGPGSTLGNLATKWIGGLAHELGHGLNAPHNKQHKSDEATLGTALMGSGNYTYGKNPTFITDAMSGVFANSQTFRRDVRTDWYQLVKNTIEKLTGEFVDGKIIVSGRYTSSVPVKNIVVFLDPDGGADYDAPTWLVKPGVDNTFRFECPVSELFVTEGKYQLRLKFLHANASHANYTYNFQFVSGVPNIGVINTKDLVDRSAWQTIAQDSQESDGQSLKILDNDQTTVWHTTWRGGTTPHPHFFVVDMASIQNIKGLAFANRSNLNGCIKDFEIFGSNDNVNWTSLGSYSLKAQTMWQYVDLNESQSYRYLKLITKNSNGGFEYAHLAEFAIY